MQSAKISGLLQRDDHERLSCRFRIILCPNGCGESMVSKTSGKHMSTYCELRLIDCPLLCGAQFRHRELTKHLELDCKKRLQSEDFVKALQYGKKFKS